MYVFVHVLVHVHVLMHMHMYMYTYMYACMYMEWNAVADKTYTFAVQIKQVCYYCNRIPDSLGN